MQRPCRNRRGPMKPRRSLHTDRKPHIIYSSGSTMPRPSSGSSATRHAGAVVGFAADVTKPRTTPALLSPGRIVDSDEPQIRHKSPLETSIRLRDEGDFGQVHMGVTSRIRA